MPRIFIMIGVCFITLGLLWPLFEKMKLGRLPGDISFHKGSFTFYFPIVTCIIISLIVSALLWIFRK